MPTNPLNQNVYILEAATALVRERFSDMVAEYGFRHGRVLSRLFKPGEQMVEGDGLVVQGIARLGDSVRMNNDALSDFHAQNMFSGARVKIRFNSTDASVNDLPAINSVAKITDVDLVASASRSPQAVAVDVAQTAIRQLLTSGDENTSVMMHATSTGQIALVNGTKKNGDALTFAAATTYTNGSTTCRVPVDTGSIANFVDGYVFDVYNGATLVADALQVVDSNPEDLSVRFTTTAKSTILNCDGITDNYQIYRDGEKGNGFRGCLQSTLMNPTAGESFIGGVDRTTAANAWLRPTVARSAGASEVVSKKHFNDLGLQMGLTIPQEDLPGGFVCISHPAIVQALRDSIGDAALTQQPPLQDGEYNFGSKALYWIHPTFGRLAILEDPLCMPDRTYVLSPSTWRMYTYGWTGWRWVGGSIGGMWRYLDSTIPGNGSSKFLTAQGYQIKTPFTHMPRANAVILNQRAA